MSVFRILFYDPLIKLLVFFYNNIPGGLGMAVIILTILIKIVLNPVNKKTIDSQKKMAGLQPRLKELQKKYKGNKEELGRKTMELYKEVGINPFSSIILFVIQMPVLIAIYQVFREVPSMADINPFFLGIDLASTSIVLSLVASALMFVQTKVSLPQSAPGKGKGDFSDVLQKQMQFVFPIFLFFILKGIPAAIGLYLTVNALLTIIQTVISDQKGKKEA